MQHRIVFINLLLLALFLALVPTALASNNWYVDGVHGKNKNDCKSPQTACKTIGHAISLASSDDSIIVAAATYTENLTIGISLKLIGSSAKATIIDGGRHGTVVTIPNANSYVTLSKVTIRNGLARVGGGIENSGMLTVDKSILSENVAVGKCPAIGGGVFNLGMLAINNSALIGNRASCGSSGHASGGGIGNMGELTINNSSLSVNSVGFDFGAGIENWAVVTINNSTLSGNTAGFGGAIDNFAVVTINNSTLSGNNAYYIGGGILNAAAGTLTINNSTVSGNSITGSGPGGGIFNDGGNATLQNSIVANSPSGGNCSGTITSNGYNLSSDNTCKFNGPGDLNNTKPELGKLGDHGGPTQTIPLLSESPAIDAGNPSGCTDSTGHLLKTDQRGKPRPDRKDHRCDMGAYERQEN